MKKILSCIILLLISLSSVVDAGIKVPDFKKLTAPPEIKESNGSYYAVFNYGGLKFKHKITKMPVAHPQCNALTFIGREIMVIGINPYGYIFFVEPQPIAFKTDHNPIWQSMMEKIDYGQP